MKALVKNGAEHLFKRIEKPKQDLQSIMNELQAKVLANKIGIDFDEMKKMEWFFEVVKKLKLPKEFNRYLNGEKDQVIYFNELLHEETMDHPNFDTIKIFFYETIANNKSVYTFADKEKKLLPFVEEKMLRQIIGLNSKRREAEKVNLQRDENGKMVLSKLGRIEPNLKSLINARSYLLKMLAEKVFTKKELWGRGKRANAYTNILNQYNVLMKNAQPEKEDDEVENEESLELYQSIFNTSARFYQTQFGNIENIPLDIINSHGYIQSTPQNILKNVQILNISKGNIELYWLARLMDCLPMPPNWTKKIGKNIDTYIYEPEELYFELHPSYIYIMNQMNRFRINFQEMASVKQNYYLSMRQMNFYDYFERLYTVDIYGYIETSEKKQQTKIKSKKNPNAENSTDWLILEALNNYQISKENYALIDKIEEFWRSCNFKEEPWCPAVSPYGEIIWSSTINNKSINFCPYRSSISNLLKEEEKKMPTIEKQSLKKTQQPIIGLNHPDNEFERLNKQREAFLQYFILHDPLPLSQPYQIHQNLTFFNEDNFYDQIFISPFDLQGDIVAEGDDVPLWLQKCRNKRYCEQKINELQYNQKKYDEIKTKVKEYALQMCKINEPYLTDEVEKKIKNISNKQDLIRFIKDVTNIDLREDRIRRWNEEHKIEVEDQDDIFGSEISQVEVSQSAHSQSDQEEQQVDDLEPEPEKQDIAVALFENEEPDSEDLITSLKTEMKEEEIQIEKVDVESRKEYQFLENFKKTYQIDFSLKEKSSRQLDKLIQQTQVTKAKKNKYKSSHIHHKIIQSSTKAANLKLDLLEEVIDSNAYKLHKEIKANLIITNLKSSVVPIRNYEQLLVNNKVTLKMKGSRHASENLNISEMDEFSMFQSQMSDCETYEIKQLIDQQRSKVVNQQQLIEIIQVKENPQKKQIDETKSSIILEPIKQIKPEIKYDPVLKHVHSLSAEFNQFRTTFHPKQKGNLQTQIPSQNQIQKSSSLKLLKDIEMKTSEKNFISLRRSSLDKNLESCRLDLKPKYPFTNENIKQKIFLPTHHELKSTSFNRVCLGNTASHLLEKEALLRKGDLLTLQARKSLLSKGRGLQTYISKFC